MDGDRKSEKRKAEHPAKVGRADCFARRKQRQIILVEAKKSGATPLKSSPRNNILPNYLNIWFNPKCPPLTSNLVLACASRE